MKLRWIAALAAIALFCVPAKAQDFVQSYNFVNTGTNGPTTSFANTGVTSFFITWSPQVSLSACSIQVDSSSDGASWGSGDLIASTSCTTSGSSSTATLGAGKNFVRIHVTALTGNGGLNVTMKGWGGGGSGGGTNFPVLINQFVDQFNATGANLGANYTAYLNNISETPGVAKGTTTGANLNVVAYTGASSVPTQTVSVTVASLNGATDNPGAAVRISGTPGTSVNYYACQENSTSLTLQKIVGATSSSVGTVTNFISSGVTAAVGDVIKLSIVGNTLTCSRNGTAPYLQANDASSPLTTGFPGIAMIGNVATIASFTFVNPAAPANAATNIVFDGDSIIAANGNGSNNTDPATSFLYLPTPNAYVANIGVTSKCLGVGCPCISTGTIESFLSTGTSVVDTLFIAGKKNILVIFAGTNDIAVGSQTTAQTLTSLTSYITARHAVGWKVIAVPALSRLSTSNAALDAKEGIYAQLVLANSAGADAVVGLPPALIGTGASANTNLFNSDQIHPTETVHIDIFARAFIAALSQF